MVLGTSLTEVNSITVPLFYPNCLSTAMMAYSPSPDSLSRITPPPNRLLPGCGGIAFGAGCADFISIGCIFIHLTPTYVAMLAKTMATSTQAQPGKRGIVWSLHMKGCWFLYPYDHP
jgi:hypothetical protein